MKNNKIHKRVDEYLAELGDCSLELERYQKEAEKEIKRIRVKYTDDISALNDRMASLSKDLKILARKNKADIFGKKNKVKLKHGILIYAKEDKVTIPRDAVQKIEKLGWKDGIKIVKNIDRPVIEKWTDERLAAIGARKKPKVVISWEIFASNLRKIKTKAKGGSAKENKTA